MHKIKYLCYEHIFFPLDRNYLVINDIWDLNNFSHPLIDKSEVYTPLIINYSRISPYGLLYPNYAIPFDLEHPSKKDYQKIKLKHGRNFSFYKKEFKFLINETIINVNKNKKALLIGNKSKDKDLLIETIDDVHAIRGMLKYKGFGEENIQELIDKNSSPENILSTLEEMVRQSSNKDTTIFYYTGHGLNGALDTYLNPLETNEFYKIFNKIKGKKAIIIDCCYAESFCRDLDKQTIFLGSSQKDSEANYTNGEICISSFTKILASFLNQFNKVNLLYLEESYFNEELEEFTSPKEKAQKVFFKFPIFYI
ncbi:MAG: caspase family protein [Nanoarchaeota archaeon]|nr:caspase family protein [Nanoarchaeota archaeon]